MESRAFPGKGRKVDRVKSRKEASDVWWGEGGMERERRVGIWVNFTSFILF